MRFLNAIGFLTIIKIPSRFYIKQDEYHKVLLLFPAVGLIIGILSSIIFFCLNFIFPLILTVIVVAGFEIIISGAIHIDGLADTFDGVFSGEKDRLKIAAIMKKGDIGVFGALAIFFSIAFKIILYYLIASGYSVSAFLNAANGFNLLQPEFQLNIAGFMALLVVAAFTPVFGRLSMLYLFSKYEPAVKTGSLVNAFKHKGNRFDFIIALIFSSVFFIFASILAKINYYVSGQFVKEPITSLVIVPAVIAAACILIIFLAFLFASGVASFFTKRTGGLSGDIIGAVCVLSEVFFLFLNYFFIIFTEILIKRFLYA